MELRGNDFEWWDGTSFASVTERKQWPAMRLLNHSADGLVKRSLRTMIIVLVFSGSCGQFPFNLLFSA